MDGKIITDINHFKAWGNAKDILEEIQMRGKMDLLDQYISELYPDGITGSQFNDLIGIDHDEVLQALGIYNDIYPGEDDRIEESKTVYESLNRNIKKAVCEFYDVTGMDSVEMELVSFGKGEDELERFELDGIEFYKLGDEDLKNAIDICIEEEFLPEWEEQGLSSYNIDSIQYDEESGNGTVYVGLFWDEDLEESLNEAKQFYLGWRGNPQLKDGGYFRKLGQLTKKEAKDWEKCAYGSMTLKAFDSEDEYNQAIEKAKEEGKSVR